MLLEARALGFLGPGDVAAHLEHTEAFRAALRPLPERALDLGSGGGVPGLVLASTSAAGTWVLLDASERRAAFLAAAVRALGLGDRVDVIRGRAEEVGRTPAHRGRYHAVTARSFGPPAVTAECAAPFLKVGGAVVVSEPPDPGDRWRNVPLDRLGLAWDRHVVTPAGTVARLVQVMPCPAKYPRRPAAMRRGL